MQGCYLEGWEERRGEAKRVSQGEEEGSFVERARIWEKERERETSRRVY